MRIYWFDKSCAAALAALVLLSAAPARAQDKPPAADSSPAALRAQIMALEARLEAAEKKWTAQAPAAAPRPTKAQKKARRDALVALCSDRGLAFDSMEIDKTGDALVRCR